MPKTYEEAHIVSDLLIVPVSDTDLTNELGCEWEDNLRRQRLCELEKENETELSPWYRCLFPCLTLVARLQERCLLVCWPTRGHRQKSLTVVVEYNLVVVVVVNREEVPESCRGLIRFLLGIRMVLAYVRGLGSVVQYDNLIFGAFATVRKRSDSTDARLPNPPSIKLHLQERS